MKLRREKVLLFLFLSFFLVVLFLSSGKAAAGSSWARGRKSPAARIEKKFLGPGSYPPRCISKCNNCTPCRPVHVAVPPGTPVLAQYYPEAWRCKCGGKLYVP